MQDDSVSPESDGLPAVRAPLQPALFHALFFCSGMKWFGAVYSRCETDIGIGLGLITKAFILLSLTPELWLQIVVLP